MFLFSVKLPVKKKLLLPNFLPFNNNKQLCIRRTPSRTPAACLPLCRRGRAPPSCWGARGWASGLSIWRASRPVSRCRSETWLPGCSFNVLLLNYHTACGVVNCFERWVLQNIVIVTIFNFLTNLLIFIAVTVWKVKLKR